MKFLDRILGKMNLSPNRQKIVRNVSWAVIGKVVNVINGLAVGIMVARYLGPDQFGLMNYVISYVMLFSVFASFGLDGIEIRELSKNNADKNTILGTAFGLRLGFATVAICLIFVTLWQFESDGYTFAMVMVYSLSLIFMTLRVIRNYFTSIILNEYVVKTEISRTVIGALVKVGLLLGGCSLTWFIAASLFEVMLIGGGYLYSYQKKAGTIRTWKFDRSVAKLLVRESFPLMLSGAAVIVYQKINAVMIRNMMDNAAVGQFSVAAKINEMAIFIPVVISQSISPLLVKAHQKDEHFYRKKSQQFMNLMVWIAIGIAVATMLLADPAIRILYGKDYLSAIPVLQIMAWRTVFSALSMASGQMIIIEGLQRYAVFRNLAGMFVSIGLNLWLIPRCGVVGSAVAIVAALAVAGYLIHFVIKPYRFLVPVQTRALFTGWKDGRWLFSLNKFKRI